MARIRTIKPEFWKHEKLSALPEATHLLAGALLNYADDYGYFNANPALIRAECSPLREPSVSIQDSLELLRGIGYLRFGTSDDGRRYGQIVKFEDHQRVNRPSDSKISCLNICWDDAVNDHGSIIEQTVQEGNREQGTGNRERNSTPTECRSANDSGPPDCPHKEIVALYHEILPMCPKVEVWNKTRAGYLRQRWKESPSLEEWRAYFEHVSQSKFLTGRVNGSKERPPFVASLEWLIRPENFANVIEGKYHRGK